MSIVKDYDDLKKLNVIQLVEDARKGAEIAGKSLGEDDDLTRV